MLDAAEQLAERCLEACNDAMADRGTWALAALLTPDAVIEVSELTTDWLQGADELAERLAESAHHGGLVLLDVQANGPDVVVGVAWQDDPTLRIAEVRLVPQGDRISRLEWVR